MFANKLAREWKYKWFGFWGAEQKYEGKQYPIADYIDSTCPPEIIKQIVFYLGNAPVILVAQQPEQQCSLCNASIYPSTYRSDGIWLWPDTLSHDVEIHDFCIPNAMVDHILSLDGVPPEESGVSVNSLPWP
jgi:hypothetical protein